MRAIPNDAATIITNMAAFVPMVVPTTPRVTGPRAANKIMNGMGRIRFTTTFNKLYRPLFDKIPRERVVYSSTPSPKPMMPAIIRVLTTMYRVSTIASSSLGVRRSQLVAT